MRLVAGVDPLGAVAAEEILVECQARDPFEDGHAILLGRAGVDRAFVDHDIAALQRAADRFRGPQKRRQVGALGGVDGRGHGDDEDAGALQLGGIAGQGQAGGAVQLLGGHFAGVVAPGAQGVDAPLVDVEADDGAVPRELHREGQAHVAQSDDRDGRVREVDVICHGNP